MMTASYHVYFSAKDGVSDDALIQQVHAFMATQIGQNRAVGYRLLRMTRQVSFETLPDFHLIVDYASEDDLNSAFEAMRAHATTEPHASLMKMVANFKVAFSVDEEVD
jgi:hypothetical protein